MNRHCWRISMNKIMTDLIKSGDLELIDSIEIKSELGIVPEAYRSKRLLTEIERKAVYEYFSKECGIILPEAVGE